MSDHFSAAMLKFPGGDPRLGVTLSRRKVLGGLAAIPAIPVLYSIGRPPLLWLLRSRGRAAFLRPATNWCAKWSGGTTLPDIKALPIQDYYRHAQLASAETAWP